MNSRSRALACFLLASGIVLTGFSRLPAQHTSDASLVAEGRKLFARVWTVPDGLGPTFNARNCEGCHSTPEVGGSGTDERAFVVIAPTAVDPTGGHLFRRLRVETTGAVTEQALPVNGVTRRAPALFGSGVIESVPEEEIGSPGTRGRFGWKGRFRSIEDAVAAAFANELGLGSVRYPDQSARSTGHKGIELSQDQIRAVSAFVGALPPLQARSPGSAEEHGRRIFQQIGCVNCHKPSFPTLEQRGLFPYTDLLLHDMGPALEDGIDEGAAKGRDFKTPPLWGVAKTGPPYLHDGRAKNLHEAIVAHGGEAEASRNAYTKLSAAERDLLLAFLRSL